MATKPKNLKGREHIGFEDYLKANRKASREIELEQNGGRWVAKDRPHKNKKAYNRKRDRQVDLSGPFNVKKGLKSLTGC